MTHETIFSHKIKENSGSNTVTFCNMGGHDKQLSRNTKRNQLVMVINLTKAMTDDRIREIN